ncbi:POK8 protein, partial [Rostratula benghalensis]|nr:POK8 protein [Rostratula benghalensis]
MGALQPGLPSPTMLPKGWNLLVVDLKDCFFTIPLACHQTPVSRVEAARISHEQFHQNAKGLQCQFSLAINEAQSIVKTCPQCSH